MISSDDTFRMVGPSVATILKHLYQILFLGPLDRLKKATLDPQIGIWYEPGYARAPIKSISLKNKVLLNIIEIGNGRFLSNLW